MLGQTLAGVVPATPRTKRWDLRADCRTDTSRRVAFRIPRYRYLARQCKLELYAQCKITVPYNARPIASIMPGRTRRITGHKGALCPVTLRVLKREPLR